MAYSCKPDPHYKQWHDKRRRSSRTTSKVTSETTTPTRRHTTSPDPRGDGEGGWQVLLPAAGNGMNNTPLGDPPRAKHPRKRKRSNRTTPTDPPPPPKRRATPLTTRGQDRFCPLRGRWVRVCRDCNGPGVSTSNPCKRGNASLCNDCCEENEGICVVCDDNFASTEADLLGLTQTEMGGMTQAELDEWRGDRQG